MDSISGTSAALFAQMAASTQPVLIEPMESPDMSPTEAVHVSTALDIVESGVIAPIAVPRMSVSMLGGAGGHTLSR